MQAGLNLYSIRNLISTEEDFLATAHKLREMGYSYLQFSGGPYDAEMIRRVSEASGLPVLLTHVPYDRIVGDTEALAREHLSFGCRNIGLGMMPFDRFEDEALFDETIDALEAAALRLEAFGCKLFYHNHQFEFFKRNGETVLECMARRAPHLQFTLDTYWVQYGGASILSTVEMLKGRIECVHLKDYAIVKKEEKKYEPKFAPVGSGSIDFPAVVAAMKAAGAKYFFVEQDDAAKEPDPLAPVGKSIAYILNNL